MLGASPITKRQQKLITREILTGSPDRIIATASLVVGLLGLIFSGLAIGFGSTYPITALARDVSVVIFLVLYVTVLSVKYYKKYTFVENLRDLVKEYALSCHRLISKFTDHYWDILTPLFLSDNPSPEDIEAITKRYINKVCHSVLPEVASLFYKYFKSRGFNLPDNDLTVTVKAIVPYEEARTINQKAHGDRADILNPNTDYVVTLYRDPVTWEMKPERKEVGTVSYKINEENTAFDDICHKGAKCFYSNNLVATDGYRNQNPKWKQHYNSTLVVPIKCSESNTEDFVFGFLAIDSKNEKGYDLFDDDVSYSFLAQTANLLAIMLVNVKIVETVKNGTPPGSKGADYEGQ